MTHMIFVAAALASLAFGLQPAAADYYAAPWCAVIAMGDGDMQWELRVSLSRRMSAQRACRQSWLVQSEPVLCRRPHRTQALSETPRSPAVAAPPDMSLMFAIGTLAENPTVPVFVRYWTRVAPF